MERICVSQCETRVSSRYPSLPLPDCLTLNKYESMQFQHATLNAIFVVDCYIIIYKYIYIFYF